MLDTSRPYAEVHGLPGAMYEQDGKLFRGDGLEINPSSLSPIPEPEKPYKGPEINPPAVSCIETLSAPLDDKSELNLQGMHWKKLKVLVETYGGEWTNTEDAIAFMKRKAA